MFSSISILSSPLICLLALTIGAVLALTLRLLDPKSETSRYDHRQSSTVSTIPVLESADDSHKTKRSRINDSYESHGYEQGIELATTGADGQLRLWTLLPTSQLTDDSATISSESQGVELPLFIFCGEGLAPLPVAAMAATEAVLDDSSRNITHDETPHAIKAEDEVTMEVDQIVSGTGHLESAGSERPEICA